MNERKNTIALPKRELVNRFWAERHAFFGYIHRFAFDRDEAEDIFQEACLKFLEVSGKFRHFLPAAKYLYRIIFSIIVRRRRKERRMLNTDIFPDRICEPEPQWQRDLMIQKLRTAMAGLSGRERKLIAVHLIPGFRFQDQSEKIKLPTSTYRYQLNGVISKLRKQMTAVKANRKFFPPS